MLDAVFRQECLKFRTYMGFYLRDGALLALLLFSSAAARPESEALAASLSVADALRKAGAFEEAHSKYREAAKER